MNTSAIVMLLIGAVGLWGGCAVAILNYVIKSKKYPDPIDDDEAEAAA